MTPTPAQQEAITSTHPQILCVAGPGSGKTQTTVDRIRRLIETGTKPAQIVALTFTNAAANELQERICPEGHRIISTGDPHDEKGYFSQHVPAFRLGYVGMAADWTRQVLPFESEADA